MALATVTPSADAGQPICAFLAGLHAILTLGDLGRAEAGLDQDISALGTEGSGDGLGQRLDTGQERGAALDTELELLRKR